jgi:eukaryotic-like serine/threonine-protein kinase
MRVADRYTIVEPISAGSMGAVYRARDRDGREVALKRLTDHTQAARFEIEGRLLARLRHPRVVKVLGPLSDRDGRWLAMELVAGPDLLKVSRERGRPGLPADEVRAWGRQACEALDYVHAQQVVHRDIKPSNLILGPDGIVLVDFGIARTVDPIDAGTRGVGTPRYMAPEVAVGGRATPRSDLYGLAATMLALLTGRPPGETSVPDFLRGALHPDPARRPASAAAFAAQLGAPLAGAADELAIGTQLVGAVARATAAAFDAAAVSLATFDGDDLVYCAAWGAGAEEIIGMRLPPGTGLAQAVAGSGAAEAVADCRSDPRFAGAVARRTGYVPHTMLLAPFAGGVLSILDRRDGRPYTQDDLPRAGVFADLAASALR